MPRLHSGAASDWPEPKKQYFHQSQMLFDSNPDSQSNHQPETGIFQSQTSQKFGPKECHDIHLQSKSWFFGVLHFTLFYIQPGPRWFSCEHFLSKLRSLSREVKICGKLERARDNLLGRILVPPPCHGRNPYQVVVMKTLGKWMGLTRKTMHPRKHGINLNSDGLHPNEGILDQSSIFSNSSILMLLNMLII